MLAERHLPAVRFQRVGEGMETFLLILVVVVVIRTFFLLPSAIPSGSMQPTLYGVTVADRRDDAAFRMPGRWRAWIERFCHGRIYYHVVARAPGRLEAVRPPESRWSWLPLPLFRVQRFRVGDAWYRIPAPPGEWAAKSRAGVADAGLFLRLAGVDPERVYQTGEVILQAVLQAGDRVLVDRLTYQFRRPRRGEIVVFRPRNVPGLKTDTFYLKRLVGLPGERIRISDDRRLWINGRPLDPNTPPFRRVFSFHGPPRPGRYAGYLNERQARRYWPGLRGLSPFFPTGRVERRIPNDAVALLGDNTMESSDSRQWGWVPERDLVGRVLWVYWPCGGRWGRGFTR